MRFALGVDGGASKTHALVVEETGKVLGFGVGGTGNHQVSGLESALHEINWAVKEALGIPTVQSIRDWMLLFSGG